jgi:aminopeptidase N
MTRMLRVGALGLLLAGACRAAASGTGPDLAPLQPGLDYHSFANVEQFRVTHLQLDLRVDFANKVMFGAVTLELKRLDPRATELVLDTRNLDIRDVEEKPTNLLGATAKDQTTWVSRPFHLDKADPILGSPLIIELPPSKKSTETVRIEYVTSPGAPALQWLTDKQTAGKHHPFMYTESESIGARSWIPLQDTPQIRFTYGAHIYTPSDLVAVMSAKNDPNAKRNGSYVFDMPDPIPSYLVALAVGDLHFKATGPRSGVYAEKAVLAAAVKEFADTEAMISAAEKLFGPYRWDRYDMLILPPSYPLGGMENPRLSFITPTVIAGDKSLVSLIAHELSHSWSGNLVTSATWRDTWLNEGLTDYLQSRIVAEVYGERRDSMERVLDLRALQDDLARLPPKDQVLAMDLRGRDPDDAFGNVAYDKGSLLFTYLDAKFGRERFDEFLRAYFEHFAFKSINTDQFVAYLDENLLTRFPGLVSRAQVLAWVGEPGLPADAVLPSSDAFAPVDQARKLWLDGKVPAKKLDTRNWVTQQWLYFLDNMPPLLRKDQLADLDAAFNLTRSGNAEVAESWFLLVIRNAYAPSYPRLEEYLVTVGRRKLIVPLYEELMKSPAGSALAKRVYAQARSGYHPLTVAVIEPIVNPDSEKNDDE